MSRLAWFSGVVGVLFSISCGCTPSEPVAEGPKFRVVEEGEQPKPPVNESKPVETAPKNERTANESLEAEAGLVAGEAGQRAAQQAAEGEGAADRPILKPPFDKLSAELQKKISDWQRLTQAEPQGRTQQQRIQSMMRIQKEIVRLCDEIYADEGLSAVGDPKKEEALRNETLRARLDALTLLVGLQSPGAMDEVKRTADVMLKNPDRQYAFMGRLAYVRFTLEQIGKSNPPDGALYLEEIDSILKEWSDQPPAMAVCQNIAELMLEKQYIDDGAEAMLRTSAVFLGNAEPQVAAIANDMHMRGLAVLATQGKKEGRAEAKKKLLDHVMQLTDPSAPLEAVLQSLLQVTLDFETSDTELAEKIYARIDEAYGKNANKELAIATGKAVENGRKRMSLVGKPFELTAMSPEGTPFDWKKYEGKVVLIDFWATWCRPCLEEMSNIAAQHRKFHDLGFEVVGVNLDDELETVGQFVKQAGLPWEVVVSADDTKVGFKTPAAVECGVDSIPFVILVGRDGKVDSIHVRGARLGERLKELLGEPKPAEKEAEEKPAATEKPEEKEADQKPAATEKPAAEEKPAETPK